MDTSIDAEGDVAQTATSYWRLQKLFNPLALSRTTIFNFDLLI